MYAPSALATASSWLLAISTWTRQSPLILPEPSQKAILTKTMKWVVLALMDYRSLLIVTASI